MAFFTPLTFNDFRNLIIEAYNESAAIPANTDPGSSMGAAVNAAALLGLQLQRQAMYDAAISRMATSTGADCDSLGAQFDVPRIDSNPTSGPLRCSTNSPVSGSPLPIPVGGMAQTDDGLIFEIIADPTNPAYNPTSGVGGGYPIAVGQSHVDATVECTVPGSIGRVAENQITQIFGGPGTVTMPNVNVTNLVAFTNGSDGESDDAYKARFTKEVSSGRAGVRTAIEGAILGVQTDLTYSLGDRMDHNGATQSGYFTAFVDVLGQTAAPSDTLLTEVYTAIDAVRGLGISFTPDGGPMKVSAPSHIHVNVTGVVTVNPASTDPGSVLDATAAALGAFINNIGLDPEGNSTVCSPGKIYKTAFAVADVIDFESLTLNGATAPITAGFGQRLVAGSINLSLAS